MNTDYSVCQAYFTDLVTFQCINHEGSNYYETCGDYSVFAICDNYSGQAAPLRDTAST
jgi:hypothetical protein